LDLDVGNEGFSVFGGGDFREDVHDSGGGSTTDEGDK